MNKKNIIRNTGHCRLLAAALLFTIIIRGVPLINSGLPYGYDGFYHTYKVYNILETASINYNLYLPPTLNIFVAIFALLGRVDILSIVRFIPVLTSVLVVLSLYLLVRDMFKKREDAHVIAAAAASVFSVNEFYLFYSSTYLAESLALIMVLIFIYTLSNHRYRYLPFIMLFVAAAFHHVLSLLLLLSLITGVFLSKHRRYYLSMAVFLSLSIALFWRGLYWDGVQFLSAGAWSPSISSDFLDQIIKFKWILVGSIIIIPLVLLTLYRIPRYIKIRPNERTVFALVFLSQVTAIVALPVISAYLHITTSRVFYELLLNHLGEILTISLGAAGMVAVLQEKSKDSFKRELNHQSRFMFYWLIATAMLVIWGVAGAGKIISLTRMLVYLAVPLSIFAGRYLAGAFSRTPSTALVFAVVLLVVVVVPINMLNAYPDKDMAYKSGINYQYHEPKEYISSLWISRHIPEDRVFAADIRTGGQIRGMGHNIVPNGYFYKIMAPEELVYQNMWSIANISDGGRAYRVNALESFSNIFKGNAAWRDYIFEAMVRIEDYNPSNSKAAAGLMFRSDMSRGNIYYFGVYPGAGMCRLYTYNRYVARLLDKRPCSLDTGVWYKLKVKVNGSGISYYLDNNELGHVNSYSHPTGNIGIGAIGTKADFDNVSVRMLNGTVLLEEGFENGSTAGWEIMQWDVMTLLKNVTYKSRDGRRREGIDYIYISDIMQMPGAILIIDPGSSLMHLVPLGNKSISKWESPGFNRVYDNSQVKIYGVMS